MTAGDRSSPDTGSGAAAADEPVEVLDSDGSVIAVAPRSRMRAERLAHRSTFVLTVIAPPPAGDAASDLALRTQRWFDELTWPVVGPGSDVRPLLAPTSLTPAIVLDPGTPLIVHRRADWKDINPGAWDLAFGGVCGVGEGWLESAERELTEEAGLPTATTASGAAAVNLVAVVPMAAARYIDDETDSFGGIFMAFAGEEPTPTDGEVVAVDRIALGDVSSWVEGRTVCQDSTTILVPVVEAVVGPA